MHAHLAHAPQYNLVVVQTFIPRPIQYNLDRSGAYWLPDHLWSCYNQPCFPYIICIIYANCEISIHTLDSRVILKLREHKTKKIFDPTITLVIQCMMSAWSALVSFQPCSLYFWPRTTSKGFPLFHSSMSKSLCAISLQLPMSQSYLIYEMSFDL